MKFYAQDAKANLSTGYGLPEDQPGDGHGATGFHSIGV